MTDNNETKQAATVERVALIRQALSVVKQDYSDECSQMATRREYVEDAVSQMIDAGYRVTPKQAPAVEAWSEPCSSCGTPRACQYDGCRRDQIAVEARDADRQFATWFAANYPGPDTIIHDPYWHAPRILRAARAALARVSEAAAGEPEGLFHINGYLEEVGVNEDNVGDLSLTSGDRKLSVTGITKTEARLIGKLLFQSVTLSISAPQPATAPAGWKLVPTEPTPLMSAAGFAVSEAEHDPAQVYRAMIEAAPQPASELDTAIYVKPSGEFLDACIDREQQIGATLENFNISKEWLSEKLAAGPDDQCAAGDPALRKKTCATPPGCNAGNCLGCGESQPASEQQAPTDAVLVELFYAAQSDITQFRIKARAILAAKGDGNADD